MIKQLSPNIPDYELLDTGDGEKLERFGKYVVRRPEPQAIWRKSLSDKEWLKADASFLRDAKVEDRGEWRLKPEMPSRWSVRYDYKDMHLRMRLALTSFKHVGIFPEQAANWEFIYDTIDELKQSGVERPKVLNLFAYTGGATLAARSAGADVTHVDSVKQVVTWARENMESSGLDGVRWIVEDALKFARREAKRGNTYQGIILDPPAYGHGPDGEKWKLDECLNEMLQCVAAILAPQDSFMVLNLYSNGYSAVLGETIVKQAFCMKTAYKSLDFGELVLRDSYGKNLPLSVFVRLAR